VSRRRRLLRATTKYDNTAQSIWSQGYVPTRSSNVTRQQDDKDLRACGPAETSQKEELSDDIMHRFISAQLFRPQQGAPEESCLSTGSEATLLDTDTCRRIR
jgi:hypothetical protein